MVAREKKEQDPHQVEPQLQSLVHHLLGLAVILVLILTPVSDNLLKTQHSVLAKAKPRGILFEKAQLWTRNNTSAEMGPLHALK